MTIVTRFAPSPTGFVHIGSLRTVLYNYLYTKQNDGKFMLRIEDTDRARFVEGSVENLQNVLASVGLIPDEGPNNPGDKGPYFQSERLDIYQTHIKTLLDDDKAYYCFCSSDRLTELREEQQSLGLPTKYDKKCRYLTPEETQEKLDAGAQYTIRLKVPDNTEITFEDAVRGKITIPSKDVDEQVLMKTDGFPTYHFAVVVDDHLMGVTDIIRGDEWIPSTPKHVLLYSAFGWEMPKFSHVPPLLGEGGKKLSKRTGDVSVESFLAKGFLPEAMLNYISLLGWNPKTTQEIFSMSELIEKFKLSDVHRAGAIFEESRMEGFNSEYIKSYETTTLWNKIKTYLGRYDNEYLEEISNFPEEYILKILEELKTRMKKLEDFKTLTQFFFTDVADLDPELIVNKKMKIESLTDVKTSLTVALEILENVENKLESIDEIKNTFIDEIKNREMKNGQVLWPVRVALSMQQFSPGGLELIYIFGREKSIQRITKVLKQI
ncbi:glutamate--tRNA ligase [Candidatus Gracilibacteria bacterium]|nr:glutamate--tRNA ligase [Candidatus Gracilibacteria bacterium]